MLLNFSRPQLAPNIVSAPTSNVDINSVLGLAKSQYDGLQSVGDTGYFFGDGRMYQPYTPQPSGMVMSGFGSFPMYYQQMFGMSQPHHGLSGASNRFSQAGGPEEGTIYRGDQAFRPVSADVTGFNKTKGEDNIYDYAPSMSYVYANAPRPAPTPTPNVTSFLSTPTAMATPTGNYGAGRFLSGLLGSPITYGLPNGETASDS
jgi:hypothetical protein